MFGLRELNKKSGIGHDGYTEFRKGKINLTANPGPGAPAALPPLSERDL